MSKLPGKFQMTRRCLQCLIQMNIDLGDALIPINSLRFKLESSESETVTPLLYKFVQTKGIPCLFPIPCTQPFNVPREFQIHFRS